MSVGVRDHSGRWSHRILGSVGLLRPLRRVRRWVRSHVARRCLERRILEGYRLVPEEALTRCYCDALVLLRERAAGQSLGDYLEFGVYHGASLACMHRATSELGIGGMRLFGFDSFQGMPPETEQEEGAGWLEGDYRSRLSFTRRFLRTAEVDLQKVVLVKGWYRNTLTPGLIKRHNLREASIVMVDCDIYTSASEALRFCESLIRDNAVILFDDWHSGGDLAARGQGEKRAFDEFLARNPHLKAVALPSYRPEAKVFHLIRRSLSA